MVVKLVSRPAQPALVHVEHAAARRFFGDDVLRLALGAHEHDGLAFGGELADEILCLAVMLDGLAEVEDVDARALAEDERLHLGIPTLGLVSEMHACFEQVLHRERGQTASIHVMLSTLTLTELEPLTGAGHPVLLALFRARVAREQAVFLEARAELDVELAQRAGDAEADRAGLARHAAATDGGEDIELFGSFREQKRRLHQDAKRFAAGRTLLNSRRLTLMAPVPGRRNTRAVDSLRRPVA